MKNQKPSFITLSLTLALTVVHLVILFLGIFGVLVPSWQIHSNFNYLIAFCLIAVNFILVIVFMAIEKHKLLVIPEWFRVVFFIGFFVFTNIYYFFNLYSIIYTEILFYMYLATVLTILSISIFYNVQKDEKGMVKSNNKFACVSTFTYSTSMFLIIETIVTAIKVVANGGNIVNGLTIFLINSSISILVSLCISIIFYVSLNKTKRAINRCLIKVNTKAEELDEQK